MGRLFASILFPGLGHLLAGRYLKGAVLAVAFALAVDALLVGGLVWPEPFQSARLGLGTLAVGIWVYGWAGMGWYLLRNSGADLERRKDYVLSEGLRSLLRRDAPAAQRAFRAVLRLDDRDLEGWLYLGRSCQLMGQWTRARCFYRAARRLDVRGKWSWELERRLKERRRPVSDTTS